MKKLKNIIQILVTVCFVLLFQACPDNGITFLELKNNSNDTLAVYVADGLHTAYPDTLLPDKYEDVSFGGNTKSNMTGTIYNFVREPEKIYKQLPKDTLSIFILNMNNMNNMNNHYDVEEIDSMWKEMNYGKRFLWRYDISLQDLRQLNFLLSYPPDERMKYMKMYPPYGSK